MSCERVQPELVAYHFGAVTEPQRAEIEAHLPECSECLKAFLSLKRAIETGEGAPMPSIESHDRLRREMKLELARIHERRWSWWERPLAFACAASVVLASTAAMHTLTSGPGGPPHALSAR